MILWKYTIKTYSIMRNYEKEQQMLNGVKPVMKEKQNTLLVILPVLLSIQIHIKERKKFSYFILHLYSIFCYFLSYPLFPIDGLMSQVLQDVEVKWTSHVLLLSFFS